MRNSILNAIIQQRIQERFKSPQEREFEQISLEQKRLDAELNPLEDYERMFSNKWNRYDKTQGLENTESLEKLLTSNKVLYDTVTKNLPEERKIAIKDAYENKTC